MASSNRFAALADNASSSKELVTGTKDKEDQAMPDTGSAGPSNLTREEGIALFKKKRLIWLAENEENERAEKSRQKSKPSTSANPPRGLRKRSASSDEAEEPLKRRRLELVASTPKSEEPATPSSAAPPEGDPAAQGVVPYIDPTLIPWWANIQAPEMPLPCIIQVNDYAIMGSFDESIIKWAFHLTFDAGPQQSPAMTMKFFSKGVRGPQSGETRWLLSDVQEDEWMVLNFQIFYLADRSTPTKSRISNRKVLEACPTEERNRLICIRLKAWPKVIGPFDGQARKYFPDVFTGRQPYQIHVWFIAPHDVEIFEQQCLKFYTHYFKHRPPVHSKIPPL